MPENGMRVLPPLCTVYKMLPQAAPAAAAGTTTIPVIIITINDA
jgi:hypothetical protein